MLPEQIFLHEGIDTLERGPCQPGQSTPGVAAGNSRFLTIKLFGMTNSGGLSIQTLRGSIALELKPEQSAPAAA